MQFPNPIVNQLIIYGAGDNLPDVTIGPTPLITFYNGTNVIMRLGLFDASLSPRLQVQNTIGYSLEVGLDPSSQIPRIQFSRGASPNGTAVIQFRAPQLSPLREALEFYYFPTSGSAIVLTMGQNLATAANEIVLINSAMYASNPLTVGTETWHTATLQNGWSSAGVAPFAPVQYRLLPDNMVLLRGVATGGVIAAGTTVFALPSPAYVPPFRKQFPISMNSGTALTAVCQVIENTAGPTAGNVNIYGVAAGNAIVFDGITFEVS